MQPESEAPKALTDPQKAETVSTNERETFMGEFHVIVVSLVETVFCLIANRILSYPLRSSEGKIKMHFKICVRGCLSDLFKDLVEQKGSKNVIAAADFFMAPLPPGSCSWLTDVTSMTGLGKVRARNHAASYCSEGNGQFHWV